jgi:hypothetical protein
MIIFLVIFGVLASFVCWFCLWFEFSLKGKQWWRIPVAMIMAWVLPLAAVISFAVAHQH